MAARIPVKAIYSGSDVTSLGEFTSSDTIAGSYLTDGSVTAAKLAADTATQAELDVVSGVATAALPKTGGIITAGEVDFNDNIKARFGTGKDLNIYHDGSNSYVEDASVGDLILKTDGAAIKLLGGTDTMAKGTKDGAFGIYHDNNVKLATTAQGITVTGTAKATTDTDTSNSGNVALNFEANQNFVLTLTGNVTLTNPSFAGASWQVGQSGFIVFKQDGTGSRTVSLGTDYETAGGSGLTLTATASASDVVPYIIAATNRILLGTPQLAFA